MVPACPACLLVMRKQRPKKRHANYCSYTAARHYRELSAQNELRPQDVMRMLVHYHAYGDAAKVPRFGGATQPTYSRTNQYSRAR
jgi:type I restriction enzyme M protein